MFNQTTWAHNPLEKVVECTEAAINGFVDGALNAVDYALTHPIKTAVNVAAGKYLFAYHAAKTGYEVTQIGIQYTRDPEEAQKQWKEYTAPARAFINHFLDPEIELAQKIGAAVFVVADWNIQAKLRSGLENISRISADTINEDMRPFLANGVCPATNQASFHPIRNMESNPLPMSKVCLASRTKKNLMRGYDKKSLEVADRYFKKHFSHLHGCQKDCPPSCMIQYEKLKADLRVKEYTSILGLALHGLERLIERGFTPEKVRELYWNPDIFTTQADGADVFIKIMGENKHNVMVYTETDENIISAVKHMNEKRVNKMGNNYGWKI